VGRDLTRTRIRQVELDLLELETDRLRRDSARSCLLELHRLWPENRVVSASLG
jgi:hypothetical protein